jgi:hypothetical protein
LEDIELKIEPFRKIQPVNQFYLMPKHISRLIVQIQPRKVEYSSGEVEIIPKDSFTTEEWAVKVDGNENELKTKIKVFVCPGGHSYFRNLKILDEEVSWKNIKENYLFKFKGNLRWHLISQGDLKDEKHKVIKIDISKIPLFIDTSFEN